MNYLVGRARAANPKGSGWDKTLRQFDDLVIATSFSMLQSKLKRRPTRMIRHFTERQGEGYLVLRTSSVRFGSLANKKNVVQSAVRTDSSR
jgi:hypothetical protein